MALFHTLFTMNYYSLLQVCCSLNHPCYNSSLEHRTPLSLSLLHSLYPSTAASQQPQLANSYTSLTGHNMCKMCRHNTKHCTYRNTNLEYASYIKLLIDGMVIKLVYRNANKLDLTEAMAHLLKTLILTTIFT
jgi:hypothetical protein